MYEVNISSSEINNCFPVTMEIQILQKVDV